MLFAVISMEPHLAELPFSTNDLLTAGATHARDVQALCNDVAAVIFPSAIAPPTEATISAVTGKLIALVSDIEAVLRKHGQVPTSALPGSWPLLAQSGFLREPDLIDFVLARVSEDRLATRLSNMSQALPAQLLDHADPNVAETAQALLAANSLHRRAKGFSYKALRPELLHQLCWRLVAAIEVADGARDASVVSNARTLLADYDEAATAQVAASKLVHFLGRERDCALADPENAGLQLYIAYLANRLGLDQDHILNLIASGSAAPLAIILRAVGNDAAQAMEVIYLFNGFSLTPRDIGLFEQGFERLDVNDAKAEIIRWSSERGQFLMFPHGSRSGSR
jgi:hypothetical protein